MKIHYMSHHGEHQVAIVLCPEFARRFLHLSKDKDGGWVLRDYAHMVELTSHDIREQHHSVRIENEVWMSLDKNYVLADNLEEHARWKNHLENLTNDMIHLPDFKELPTKRAEFWKPFK